MELTASKIVVIHVRWPRVNKAASKLTRLAPSLNGGTRPGDRLVSKGRKSSENEPPRKKVRAFRGWMPVADSSKNASESGSLLKGVVESDDMRMEKTMEVELVGSKSNSNEGGISQPTTCNGSESPQHWGRRSSEDGPLRLQALGEERAEIRALLLRADTVDSSSAPGAANIPVEKADIKETCQEANTMDSKFPELQEACQAVNTITAVAPEAPKAVGTAAVEQPKAAVVAAKAAVTNTRKLQSKKAKVPSPMGSSGSGNQSTTLPDNNPGSKSTTLPGNKLNNPRVPGAQAKQASVGVDSPGPQPESKAVVKKPKPAKQAAPRPKAAEVVAAAKGVKTPVANSQLDAVAEVKDVVINVGGVGIKPCKKYSLDGKCRYGQGCKFAHSGPSTAEPCREYVASKTCKFANCRFAHDAPVKEAAAVLESPPIQAPQVMPSTASGPPPPEEEERKFVFEELSYLVVTRSSRQLLPESINFSGSANARSLLLRWQNRLLGTDVDGDSMSSDSKVGKIMVPSEVFHGFVSLYCVTAHIQADEAKAAARIQQMRLNAAAAARRMERDPRYSKCFYRAVGHELNDPPLPTREEWLAAWMDAAAFYQIVVFPRLQSTQSIALQRQLLSNAAIASYNSLRPVSTCDCVRSALSSCLCGVAGLFVAGLVAFGGWVCETGGRLAGGPKRPATNQTPGGEPRAEKKVRQNMSCVYDNMDTLALADPPYCVTQPQVWDQAFSRLMSASAGGYKPDACGVDAIITDRTSGNGPIAHSMGGVDFKRDYRPGSVSCQEGKEPEVDLKLLIDPSHSGRQVGKDLPINGRTPKFNTEKLEERRLRELELDGEEHFREEVKDESNLVLADKDGLALVGIGWMSAIPVVPRRSIYNDAGIIARHYGNPNDICECLPADRVVCPSCTLWRRNSQLVEFVYQDIEVKWRATSRYQQVEEPEIRPLPNGYMQLDKAAAAHPVDDIDYPDPAECLVGLPEDRKVAALVERLDAELKKFGHFDARHSEATRPERWWYWYGKLRPEQKRLYMEDAHLTLTDTYSTSADPRVLFGSQINMKSEKFVLISPGGVGKDEPTNKYPRGICPANKVQANAITGPANAHIKAKLVYPLRSWIESFGYISGAQVPPVCMASGFTGAQVGAWMGAQLAYAEAHGVNVVFLEGDMSRYDSTQNWGFVTTAGKVMLRLLDEPTKDEVCSIETLKRRFVYTRFGKFLLVGATTSGVGSTTNGNTIGNINGLYGCVLSARNSYTGRRLGAPRHQINLLALGDDSLVALFDIDECEAIHVVTTVDKDLRTMGLIPKMIMPFVPSFCSQLFYPVIINGRETYTMGPEICRWMARHGWTTKCRKDSKCFTGLDCAALNKGLALSNPHWKALPVMRVVHEFYVASDAVASYGLLDEYHGKIASQEDKSLTYSMSTYVVSFVLRVYGITTDELLALESLIAKALRAAKGGCVMINSVILDQMALHLDSTRSNIV